MNIRTEYDESKYQIGDLYCSGNVAFEVIDFRIFEERKKYECCPTLISCMFYEWDLRSILPAEPLKFMAKWEHDESGRLIFKPGSDNPLDHIGFTEITSWSQMSLQEVVTLHVLSLERG